MAHSYISYHDENIRINDFDLIALVFLIRTVNAQGDEKNLLSGIFPVWIDSIENDGAGNIDLKLDSLLVSPEHVTSLLAALDDVKQKLAELPDVIPADFLRKLINIEGIEFGSYKKAFLVNLANAFDQLLKNASRH